MTEEELRKNYYADRPSEPYSDDDRPSDWANIAHYAEENLENAFKRIEELGKENAELKEEIKNNEDLATIAYMQGAERYKPKWHKVADGDLPKHEVNVLVLHSVQCVDIAHYNYDYKEWHFADSIVRDVIAWCEIPKYTEE